MDHGRDLQELEEVCKKVISPRGKLTDYQQLSNGAVNITYRFRWNGVAYVKRLYIRDPLLAEIENQVIKMVKDQVCVPELIYSQTNEASYAIFRFVEGKHLFEIEDTSLASEISYELGKTLAKIHRFRFPEAGLFGPGLTIKTLFAKGSSPYYEYIQDHLTRGSRAWERLGDKLAEEILGFTKKNKHYFPQIQEGGVLVHSDFKPVNLLWNKGVTVLDWEFAHSGVGLMDFAILLRHAEDFPLSLVDLERGYTETGGALPTDWVKKAQITDFVNVIQLLDRGDSQKLKDACQFTMDHWEL